MRKIKLVRDRIQCKKHLKWFGQLYQLVRLVKIGEFISEAISAIDEEIFNFHFNIKRVYFNWVVNKKKSFKNINLTLLLSCNLCSI